MRLENLLDSTQLSISFVSVIPSSYAQMYRHSVSHNYALSYKAKPAESLDYGEHVWKGTIQIRPFAHGATFR